MTSDQILVLALAYSDNAGCGLSTVGRRAVNNNRVFFRLAQGRGCNSRTLERAAGWFTENWPAEAPWPKEIPRAAAAKEPAA